MSKKLDDIVNFIKPDKVIDPRNIDITGISHNSKTTQQGDIFVCLKGETSDGHGFAQMAFENGAVAFLCEHEITGIDAPQLIVGSTKKKIADLAGFFHDFPSRKLNLIGITGTNGKTTVTHLLQKILEDNNQKCALIGTLGYKLSSNDAYLEAKHTTPQAPELQATLNKILDAKIENVVMEVSSHALEQNRVGSCFFNGAVLTNLTQDHLDYHITMNNYFESKATLFTDLDDNSFAVINNDDNYSQKFIEKTSKNVKIWTYGVENEADVTAKNIKFSIDGASMQCRTPFGTKIMNLQLNGMFSVYNALAALTTALAMGIDLDICIKALQDTKSVAGRFEIVTKKPLIIVDYAHTPDGLENVLKAARQITPKNANLICLFGCGGDRDVSKRPKMGAIADLLADKLVITSDNPRSENPNLIISDIMTGISSTNPAKISVEPDRGSAIAYLKRISNENDVIIVAGKGHEDYQILNDRTIHFDDREEVRKNFPNKINNKC